jgi:hypothetical protein
MMHRIVVSLCPANEKAATIKVGAIKSFVGKSRQGVKHAAIAVYFECF